MQLLISYCLKIFQGSLKNLKYSGFVYAIYGINDLLLQFDVLIILKVNKAISIK
jgi:hypothetical protein